MDVHVYELSCSLKHGARLRALARIFFLLSCALSCAALATDQAGDSDAEVAPATAAESTPPHVNLQVLPGNTSKVKLGRLMRGYERDLGVTCGYCHVENRDTGELDYVSDENPRKEIARIMIGMLEDINGRHLAKIGGDARYAPAISCGNCHQGRANPPSWEAR